MTFFIEILAFIVVFILMFCFNRIQKYQLELLEEKIIKFEQIEIMQNKSTCLLIERIARLENLLDIVNYGICNPVTKMIYSKLRDINYNDFPKNIEEMDTIIKKISFESFNAQVEDLKKNIAKTVDVNFKNFLKNKLEKLYEAKNLAETLDENSSEQYKNIINKELDIVINDLRSDYEGELNEDS